jgi:Ion transport protein
VSLCSAGGASYIKQGQSKAAWVLLSAAVADLAFAFFTPATYFRLAPLIRISIYANASVDVRQGLFLFLQIFPGLVSVIVLTLLNLCFFSFFGLVLFNGIKGSEHYFGTFGRAMWQLWVMATTSNWPDVCIPSLSAGASFFASSFLPDTPASDQ